MTNELEGRREGLPELLAPDDLPAFCTQLVSEFQQRPPSA
jgi:hypothetical protein